MHANQAKDRLIVALDVETGREARTIAGELGDLAGGFKIGSRLFTSEGPLLVRQLVDNGHRIFLDLKFHDIPNTVAQAIEAAVATGVWMMNVHASGGRPMMEAAARAGLDASRRSGNAAPLIIGVTVLTSMDAPTLSTVGVAQPLLNQVLALAELARQAGLHGVVASPLETAAIRAACGSNFLIVTPGIRGGSTSPQMDDQSRTMGAADAVAAGADYIVVGRPIVTAPDRRAAASAIVHELSS